MQEVVVPSNKPETYELCYACMANEANAVLLCPNSHTGLCVECARKIIQKNMQCPLCRQDVAGMVHLVDPQAE